MRKVDGWTRDELTDELSKLWDSAEGTGDGEAIWRDLIADASRSDLVNILTEADRLRESIAGEAKAGELRDTVAALVKTHGWDDVIAAVKAA